MNFLRTFGNRAAVAGLLTILAGPWIEALAAEAGVPAPDIVATLASVIAYAVGYIADRKVSGGAA